MRAAIYDAFGEPIYVRTVADPEVGEGDVLVRVRATGICRSDWHGWRGHDADIRTLPHVPGHEFAGEIEVVGAAVDGWVRGDRVTVPFVAGCGSCEPCLRGDLQVCDAQSQPGFTHWGSFAELVVVRYAQHNLVRLPDALDYADAAVLGCRFTTAYRAVVHQGRAVAGESVVVYGCGGVGLSAVMVAAAHGAHVVAVDVNPAALVLAEEVGADVLITSSPEVVGEVIAATSGGADLSIDAIGSGDVLAQSMASLRKRGRHVQVGLVTGEQPIDLGRVIGAELEIIGSHGMPAPAFGELIGLIAAGRVDPGRLITRRCSLREGAELLASFDRSVAAGITIVESF